MPLIEFICPSCSLAWTHRVPVVKPDQDSQKCKRCGSEVQRQGLPSKLAIQRTGTHSATTDHVVGEDAATRWNDFNEKKEVRDKVREETGSFALTKLKDGTYQPLTPERLKERKEAYKNLNL